MNVANDEGQRAIHYAASNGHTESILQLYDLGADPNVTNNYQETAAHLASAEGNRCHIRHFAGLGRSSLISWCVCFVMTHCVLAFLPHL